MRTIFRPGGGLIQLPQAPAQTVENCSLTVDFSAFTFSGTIYSKNFLVEFPVFELSGFKILSESFDVAFPNFDVDFSMVGGALHSLDVVLPAFDCTFSMVRSASLEVDFDTFDVSFRLEESDQTAAFDIVFPLFDLSLVLQAVQSLAASEDYAVWVLNALQKTHSNYTNWQANAYAKFNGEELITLPDGVYGLRTGADGDEDVEASVRWKASDLGNAQQKRADSLAINMRNLSQADIRVVAVVDEQEERYYTKPIDNRPQGLRRFRQRLPQGLKGQTWQFGIENQAGGDMLINEIDVLVVDLTRRFK